MRPLVLLLCALCTAPILLLSACGAERPVQTAGVAAPARVRTTAPLKVRSTPLLAPGQGLLDGVPLTEDERQMLAERLPVAVMVDNYPDARPQHGLAEAEIVYEALVESGITRLMAVNWRNQAARVQPVRSARTQFLSFALELDALYAHVGSAAAAGPANAAAQMQEWGVRSIDEDDSAGAIHRDPSRLAPKNAVTSTAALAALGDARGWAGAPRVDPWRYKDDGGSAGDAVQSVTLDFDAARLNRGAFAVTWQHDPASNRYLRWQGGAPHRDAATGEQLAARNVIIQISEVRPAGDRDGHVLYTTEGGGNAVVLLDGRAVQATWRKDGRDGRTRYYDEAGQEVPLNRGNTWVELLPTGAPLAMR